MFRSHTLRKNIKNEYSITTDIHRSTSIITNTINGFTFPTIDGSASQVLSTDGNNNLSFSTISTELINDTTPQLGGDLDLNGNDIPASNSVKGFAIAMSICL